MDHTVIANDQSVTRRPPQKTRNSAGGRIVQCRSRAGDQRQHLLLRARREKQGVGSKV